MPRTLQPIQECNSGKSSEFNEENISLEFYYSALYNLCFINNNTIVLLLIKTI